MVMVIRLSVLFLLLLIISGSLLSSTPFAAGDDGRSKVNISELAADAIIQEEGTPNKPLDEEEVISIIHGRLLRANSRDYGQYDPSPALSKPPFKLIPN